MARRIIGQGCRVPPVGPSSKQPPARIVIEAPEPAVDGGRHPVKRSVGDAVEVTATIFRDGHESLRAVARHRPPGDRRWREAPLRRIDAHIDGDTWAGTFTPDALGRWTWQVLAWAEPFATWREEARRKVDAGQPDLSSELAEGRKLLADAAGRARDKADKALLQQAETVEQCLDPAVMAAVDRWPDRSDCNTSQVLEVDVDPVLARFGSWYELFPRSFGGLKGVAEQVPTLAELGFDVLYLPPIHPIGKTNRKGRNNALNAGPEDPGSPWAIGDETGGHTAIHPELGTFEDFDHLVATAREHGIELALDFAIQCSADHPWLTEHPEWFHRRPDGTLKYAENPPKKYQDIYNVDFSCADWRSLWQALLDALMFWVDRGVRVFRVDNPHTKPVPFWEWAIGEVRRTHPDTIFLAEAFTRRSMMRTLAKVGFNQSYTYFTWKNTRHELREYVESLAHTEEREYYRPNFFANTPDILTEYLQHGGQRAFPIRLVLAATLSPTYGIYSGFESYEHTPVRPGSEEYLDSEKYEAKKRKLDGPLLPLVAKVNRLRREHPALQHLGNVRFLDSGNDAILAYAKQTGSDVVLCAVNCDPFNAQEGLVDVHGDLGLPWSFHVRDLLTDGRYEWNVGGNYVRLDPWHTAAHVFEVLR